MGPRTILLGVLFWFAAVAIGVCSGPSGVPVFDASAVGDQITLDHGWLFHAGDDPGFAAPGLDDGAWTRIDLHKPLDSYGVSASTRFGWLRLHVHLRPGAVPPVIGVYRSLGRYQMFANGRLLGTVGDMDRHDLDDRAFITQFAVPAGAMEGGQELVIALRFSLQTVTYQGDPPEAPLWLGEVLLGSSRSLQRENTARTVLQTAPTAIGIVPSLLIGLVAVALFVTLRSHREYLLLAIFCVFNAAASLSEFFTWFLPYDTTQTLVSPLLNLSTYFSLFAFLRLLLPPRPMRLFGFLALAAVIDNAGGWLWSAGLISTFAVCFTQLLDAVICVSLCAMLVQDFRRGSASLRNGIGLLLPGLVLLTATDVNDFVRHLVGILESIHVNVPLIFQLVSETVTVGPFRLVYVDLGWLALELSILMFLVGRTVRIARERNRAAAEIEAAQTVQHLLLAREQTYDLAAGALGAGERMVLVSDGVPEARSATGELYGFDRLSGLTLLPAEAIADTAQRFGQEDDITVVGIACFA